MPRLHWGRTQGLTADDGLLAAEAPLRHWPGWRHECLLVVTDGADARVALLADGAGWRLPRFRAEEHHLGAAPHLRAAARRLLGVDTVLRRALWQQRDEVAQQATRAFLLAVDGTGWQPAPDARWVARAELARLPLAAADDRAALESWLALTAPAAASPLRVPWARAGWYAETVAWLDARLAALGRPRTGPAEQLRAWAISALLRAPTAGGPVYLKAVPALFAGEPALTAWLAAWQPAAFPRVLAADAARGLLLLDDVGGRSLAQEAAPRNWGRALAAFASLQRQSSALVGPLLAAGAFDRRVPWLLAGLPRLLADDAALLLGQPRGLTAAEAAALRAREATIAAACRALAASGLPDTLEHGDLYDDNVLVVGERPVFIDWSDGAVAPPFLALYCLLTESASLQADAMLAARLRDAYLEPWTALLPAPRLREIFALAQRVAPLYQALIYWHIVRHLEPSARWEWAAMVPHYLRLLLAAHP